MGFGTRQEYYRELRAPQRTLVRTEDGNWEAKWVHHGHADHYAHAEVYCLVAEGQAEPALLPILSPVPKWARPVFAGIWDKEF